MGSFALKVPLLCVPNYTVHPQLQAKICEIQFAEVEFLLYVSILCYLWPVGFPQSVESHKLYIWNVNGEGVCSF